MDIKEFLKEKRLQVEDALQGYIHSPQGALSTHLDSMAYSLSAGGKRVRPILCIAAAEALGGDVSHVLAIPCALECIHTYSLVHDDLPAMDDDDLRRGKPTNHKIYGEAGAILAGDSLLSYAFELLSSPVFTSKVDAGALIRIINIIAKAIGPLGMVGGQALDIASENKEISFETLRFIHSCKTGALITASVQSGGILGRASEKQFFALSEYGRNIGLAFQIVDDLLNVEGSADELGKAVGSDADRNKVTYPSFFGIAGTRLKAQEAVNNAQEALADFDDKAEPLRQLANYIYYRTT